MKIKSTQKFKTFFLLLFFSTFAFIFANAQTYTWAKSIGGSQNDNSNVISTDNSGNVYISGNFKGTVDFDPGSGTSNLTAIGPTDIFFAKYSSTGTYIWAKQIGGTGSIYMFPRGIGADASGNVFIAGEFDGTNDFDPGAGTANLISNGLGDMYIAKYTSGGNYIWAKRMGGIGLDCINNMKLDGSAKIYVTGAYSSTVDFDPGAGTTNLNSIGALDGFFAKYDSTGTLLFTESIGGAFDDQSISIDVDGTGKIYIAGFFQNTAFFDLGFIVSLSAVGGKDIFYAKYDASGAYLWAKGAGSALDDEARSIVLSGSSVLFLTGSFQDTLIFNPGNNADTLVSNGLNDIFLSSFDASGNHLWANSMGGTGYDQPISVAVDAFGNVFIAGSFDDVADFDPGAGTATLTAIGSSYDIYFAKYSGLGNYIWAKSFGSTTLDAPFDISVDNSSNVYLTGIFTGSTDFDPGAGTANLTSAGNSDIFFAKYYDGCSAIDTSVTISADTLTATATGATYQWINCTTSAPVSGATSRSFTPFTSGRYAVIITLGGCADTSNCRNFILSGIREQSNSGNIQLFPNPTTGKTIIRGSEGQINTIELYNILGGRLFIQSFNFNTSGQTEIDLSKNAPGIYFLKITTKEEIITRKIIKE